MFGNISGQDGLVSAAKECCMLMRTACVPATLDQRKDTLLQTYVSATDPASLNGHLNNEVHKRGVGGRRVSL